MKETERFIAHCNHYLQQSDPLIMHPDDMRDPHIDILKYPPTDRLPYWKLITMGASDIKMPRSERTLGDRNEYILLVDPEVELNDNAVFHWFWSKLIMIAMYPKHGNIHITYGHSIEWGTEEDSDMVGAYLEMPQILGSPDCMRCKLSLFKKTVLLQPVLLTRDEIDRLLEIGPQRFSYYLYPEDDSPERAHFLSERYRTDKF